MKTTKAMAAICFVGIGLFLTSNRTFAETGTWNWDSGTTEGWMDGGGTDVTVEPGWNGTRGLGIQTRVPYEVAVYPIAKKRNSDIDPGSLVGDQHGSALEMTGEIRVDFNRLMPNAHTRYVDMWVIGQDDHARFACYPYDGFGSIEDIGDGWYRYHLVNLYSWPGRDGRDAGEVYLSWDWAGNVDDAPVVLDNLVIAPETPVLPQGPANITWDNVVNISTTAGAEDLAAGGDIVLALNVGENPSGPHASIDVTNSRETITFVADQSILPNSHNSSVYSKPTGNAELDTILDSHSWKSGGTGTEVDITIDGLTPGLEYLVQVITAADDRAASSGRTQTLSDGLSPANVSDPMVRGGVGSVVGRFTAEADWQMITLSGDQDPGMSLLLVRQVPAPAAFWLLAPGLALLKRRRK